MRDTQGYEGGADDRKRSGRADRCREELRLGVLAPEFSAVTLPILLVVVDLVHANDGRHSLIDCRSYSLQEGGDSFQTKSKAGLQQTVECGTPRGVVERDRSGEQAFVHLCAVRFQVGHEALPIHRVDDRDLPGAPGPVTRETSARLMEHISAAVAATA